MIKAVLFDAIDTLFAAHPDKVGMYIRIIDRVAGLKVSYADMNRVWNEVINEAENAASNEMNSTIPALAWDGFNAKILRKLGYNGTDIDEKGETLRLESWTNPENFSLYPDVRETLEKLSEQQILIGCLSNEAEGLYKFFTHFGIDQYFKTIVISEVEGCEKPSQKIFNTAVERLGVNINEVMHVGDSFVSDYTGAKNAGLHPVLIDRDKKINDDGIIKIDQLSKVLDLVAKENSYANTLT